MALRFYTGASGAGKSTRLYDDMIARSMSEPDRNFLIIVPDQFTMQTQMDLVTRHPDGGIMNIDVLSFSRLAHRIFDETGAGGAPVLDDTGKSLVLRRLAGQLKDGMEVIGRNLNRTGYIHEVKSAISEFMQYGIGPEELDELIEYARERGALHYKLKDLGVLYRKFKEYMGNEYTAKEETLQILAAALADSHIVRGSVIAFDGFTGFTPVQNEVIRRLLTLAEDVIVTVLYDRREFGEVQEQDLFCLSGKTVRSLEKLAEEAGAGRGEDVVLLPDPLPRFACNPELSHLERQLFRYPLRPFAGECSAIRLVEASTRQEEVRQVCIAIREYIRRTGCCYRDIAVIAGDLAAYSNILETQAQTYGIPLYLDQTRNIVLNPFVEYLKSALQVRIQNYSYEAIFHYIRSGLADFTPEEADRLENYVLALGIRGKKRWNSMFIRPAADMENAGEELEALNASRMKLIGQLEPLMEKFATVSGLVEGLYRFITQNGVQQKLKEYEDRFLAEGDAVKAKEYAQIYRLVMELLDQIVELIGDEPAGMEEFASILSAGFDEIQVGTIPQNVDRVVAGDMERTRLKQVKALFFIGVNDGFIPKAAGTGGIISDIDREYLAGSGLELAPTPRQQMFIQRLYLYMNMTRPSDLLVLSWARMNGEGKAIRPSYLIENVKSLFPTIQKQQPERRPLTDQLQTMEDGKDLLVRRLRSFADAVPEEEEAFEVLFRLYSSDQEQAEWVSKQVKTAFSRYEAHPLGREAALALFGQTLLSSISRLELYASCEYAHFLQYGLGLREREGFSFEAQDMGNIFHGVLEIFGEKLKENNYTWFDFPGEEGDRLIVESVEIYAVTYGDAILFDSSRNEYVIQRLKRILKRTVHTLKYQLNKGRFVPRHFEVSFSVMEDLDSVNITLSQDEQMKLRGRIDRVDTCEDEEHVYVKVVDYKSGSRDFSLAALYYGLQLQLVVYMNAALEMEGRDKPGKQAVPAAMLYYRVQDPLIEGEEEDTSEAIEQKVRESLRMTGIVNEREEAVMSLDREFTGKSDVIPVERKKDGSYSARSSILKEEDFYVISDYVNLKIKEIGTRIQKGFIALNPYGQSASSGNGQADACTYCPYTKVCGFDRRVPGYEKRELEKLDDLSALERMRLAADGEDDQSMEPKPGME